MKCPGCGAENPEGAEYCNLCYFDLRGYGGMAAQEPLQAPPAPGEVIAPGEVYNAPGDVFQAPHAPAPAFEPAGRRDGRGHLGILIASVITAVLVLIGGGVLLTVRMLSQRTRTFSSAETDIVINYPGGWKKADAEDMRELGIVTTITPDFKVEVVLADSMGDDFKYLFMAGYISGMPRDQWYYKKSQIRSSIEGAGSQAAYGGISISDVTAENTAVGSCDALRVGFAMSGFGEDIGFEGYYIHKDRTVYMLVLCDREKGAGSDRVFKEILDSISFKSETTGR